MNHIAMYPLIRPSNRCSHGWTSPPAGPKNVRSDIRSSNIHPPGHRGGQQSSVGGATRRLRPLRAGVRRRRDQRPTSLLWEGSSRIPPSRELPTPQLSVRAAAGAQVILRCARSGVVPDRDRIAIEDVLGCDLAPAPEELGHRQALDQHADQSEDDHQQRDRDR